MPQAWDDEVMALLRGSLPDAPKEAPATERVAAVLDGTRVRVQFERHAPAGGWHEHQVHVIAAEYAVCARAFLNIAGGAAPFDGVDITGGRYVLSVLVDEETPQLAYADVVIPQLNDMEKRVLCAQLSPRVFEGTALVARVIETD